MPAPWKAVLIGGEITVLAAFTGLGLHLAMQPHRHALLAPPHLLLPAAPPAAVTPSPAAPAPARVASTPAAASLSSDWISQLGRHDRGLVKSQWDILEGLIGGVERYLRERVVPQLEQRG
ncbi:MAG TPA: hypothetical protein VLS53_04720 [Candidatus Dormibacteraeota bacterium]|nr:hypothetical protein [Candidatus Dormibacteraeota bacterium]